ncbi:hypothetical protein SUGI_1192920 [Cryptomeria japonica]|uniref:putative leucine-rich repeat receptor-like serine/threonine-protein kinase At2g24130 n=1 Tax=Cryptomeria japonica TaxID=3369 RepID=UPI0024147C36|nr:putative leucine-rich repeat receptor-like serine/threonine-protein kinase At2g24130 [Cryptomeria japonica]GLJ55541.1 hypothetical protein SUGI_1192920 [Cryptomeria japonica]
MTCFVMFLFVHCVLLMSAQLDVSAEKADENTVASLMALRLAVIHDPFSALQSWNESSRHFCNWTGVKCRAFNQRMDVVEIDLKNLSLGGFIPSEIANLSSLQILDLSLNSFRGHIPPALGRLRKLKQLHFSKNNLTGNIPSEFGNLGSLEILSSYGNNHSGSIPEELGNCSMLRKIDLSNNQLTGTLAPAMGKLSRLVLINLDYNYLTGPVPPSLFNCTALRNLSLNFNGFSGPIPADIGARLPHLDWLLLAGNNISGGIPKSLANCSRLSHVELAFNKLGGIIPQELGKLSRLTVLNMPSNEFVSGTTTGPIPILEALSNCSKLQKLDLSANHITGTLPASIFSKLSGTLVFLNLEKNNISGSMPKEIGNLSFLVELYMDKNSLVGAIPSEIANLLNLAAIDLSQNKLQGSIPAEIQFLNQSLQYLYLNDNMLSGSIPESIGELEYLRTLNLSLNRFDGRIPSAIGRCKLLEDLHLCCNNLSGSIPSEIANLRNLNSFLDLSYNKLTGPVPAGIGGMQMIQAVDLSVNNLSGGIPAQITGLVGLEYLNLSHNHLQGVLPSAIGQKLSILQTLDLAHNNITGPVPASISKLEMLEILNLSYNNFTGQIPCSGAVKKMNKTSFLGNPGLCGNCSGLTACSLKPTKKRQKKRKTILIGVSVGIVGALLFTGLVLWIIWNCTPKRVPRPSSQHTFLKTAGNLKISMEELKRATGNYSRDNLIGAGSYGSVYRGVLSNGENVAVKVFTASNSESAERSFIKECKTLGKVRHRNLVKIITSCSTADFQALVLPLMANGSLDRHLQGDQRLSLQRQLSILSDVAHGLSYLHHDCSPQIVHCDLKPQNVLLDEDMTAHVADFGIARLFSPTDDAATTTSALKGTVGYIPPEYGFGGTISTKGDVYSYGILMLQMLTEKQPTDEMFTNGLSFPEWVSTTIPSILVNCMQDISLDNIPNRDENVQRAFKHSILEGLLQLGLWCTIQTPSNRPSMQQVESALVKMTDAINSQT